MDIPPKRNDMNSDELTKKWDEQVEEWASIRVERYSINTPCTAKVFLDRRELLRDVRITSSHAA